MGEKIKTVMAWFTAFVIFFVIMALAMITSPTCPDGLSVGDSYMGGTLRTCQYDGTVIVAFPPETQ